jgi:hypothetical protein
MKNNLIAFIAALMVPLLFSQCQDHRPGFTGDIPLDPDSAKKHIIPIDTAIKYSRSFEESRRVLDEIVRKTTGDPLAKIIDLPYDESFNRDIFALLLNQEGATGIRIYIGRETSTNKGKIMMVPIDSAGNNIVKKLLYKDKPLNIPGISSAQAFRKEGEAAERGNHCSPPCPLQ